MWNHNGIYGGVAPRQLCYAQAWISLTAACSPMANRHSSIANRQSSIAVPIEALQLLGEFGVPVNRWIRYAAVCLNGTSTIVPVAANGLRNR